MSGCIYLAGGGSAHQEFRVWDAMLEGVSHLLYWPVALSDDLLLNAEAWLRASLGDRPKVSITTWQDLAAHKNESLDPFDLIFVGGGNTYDLLDRLRSAQVVPALRRFLRSGGTYYGGSAGAIVAGTQIGLASGLDPDRHQSSDQTGIGLVAADILPHFGPARVELATTWSMRHPSRPLICIPEASGVRFSHCDSIVLGPEPVSVYRHGRQVRRCDAGDELGLSTGGATEV